MKQKAKTALILSGLVTVTLHVINRIQYSNYTMKDILSSPDNHYYEWRFGKVRYTKKGTGTPLLLLHDLTVGSSNYEFHKVIDALAENHEVYALDFLGYGLSDKPNLTYTNYLYVQLINDFIKNIIGKKTDIIATGDSAPVAVMVCHNAPEVINKMIFINPQSLYRLNQIPSKQTRAMKLIMETPILGTFIYNLYTSRTSIEKLFTNEYFYDAKRIDQTDISAYVEACHRQDYKSKFAYTSYLGRYLNANIIHAVKEINHSIYILAGKEKEDNDTIVDNYEYYNGSIESVFVEKTKQLPHLERPGEVMKNLKTFLND